MKKNIYFLIIGIILSFIACNKNEITCNCSQNDSPLISFSPKIEKLSTRGENDTEDITYLTKHEIKSGDKILYATIESVVTDNMESDVIDSLMKVDTRGEMISSGSNLNNFGVFTKFTEQFNGKYISSDLMYNYSPSIRVLGIWQTKYRWKPGYTGHFFAYYPYSTDNPDRWFNGNNKSVELKTWPDPNKEENGIKPAANTLPYNEDLLYAYIATNDSKNPVRLSFKHMLAAVKFQVFNTKFLESLWDIGLKGVYSKGDFIFNSSKRDFEFQNLSSPGDFMCKPNYHATETPEGILHYNKENGKEVVFFMLPQTCPEGAKLQMAIRFSNKFTPNEQPEFNIKGLKLEAGKINTLKIRIRPMLILEHMFIGNYLDSPKERFNLGAFEQSKNGNINNSTIHTLMDSKQLNVIYPLLGKDVISFKKNVQSPQQEIPENFEFLQTIDAQKPYKESFVGTSYFRYGPNSTYAIRFDHSDNRSAWKYEYHPQSGNESAYVSVSQFYIGNDSSVNMDVISRKEWWTIREKAGTAITIKFTEGYYWIWTPEGQARKQMKVDVNGFSIVEGNNCSQTAYLKPYRIK